MLEVQRTGEEHVPCMWFVICENTTDIQVAHSVLGWTACCEGCATTVGVAVPPPVSGWRVRATFTEHGWQREKTSSFLNPLKAKCLENVKMNVELWHPKAEDIQLEVVGPVVAAGWGKGAWTESFKS